MKIYFWQNIICQMQVPYISRIKEFAPDWDIHLIVEERLTSDRIDQGWEEPLISNINLIVSPTIEEINKTISRSNKDDLHVFSGIRSTPMISHAFNLSLTKDLKRALMTEDTDLRGLRFIWRRLAGLLIEFKHRKHYDAVFAIGHRAVRWYRSWGYDENIIKPFLYCIENNASVHRSKNKSFKILFVGQLYKHKGVDILIRSLGLLNYKNWSLDIFGSGREKDKLINLAKRLNISDKIDFKGVVKNSEILKIYSQYDLYVLPSRYDGWGSTVNEALSAGVPVVCSSNCGSKALIVNKKLGDVFKGGSVQDLARILDERIQSGPITPKERIFIKKWSEKFSGKSVARYFVDIVKNLNDVHYIPKIPWL